MYTFIRPKRRELGLNPKIIPVTEKFEEWRKVPPAPGTWIVFKYQLRDAPQIGKLCKTGCCISMLGYSVILPNYWRFATQAEIDIEIKKEAQYRKPSTEDLWDLFL